MFVGALVGFKVGSEIDPWLGIVLAMVAGALLAGLHGIVTIHLQANQIVSGPGPDLPGHRRGPGAGRRPALGQPGAAAGHQRAPALADPVPRRRLLHRAVASWSTSATASCRWPRCGSSARDPDCTCVPWANSPVPRTRSASTSTASATPTSCSAERWPAWPARPSPWPWCPGGMPTRRSSPRAGSPWRWSSSASGEPGRTMFGAYMVAFIFRLTIDLQGQGRPAGPPQHLLRVPALDVLPGHAPVRGRHPRARLRRE